MAVATEYRVPLLARAAVSSSAADARLFALLHELKYREKRRDELLDRLLAGDGDQIEAVAKGERSHSLGPIIKHGTGVRRTPRLPAKHAVSTGPGAFRVPASQSCSASARNASSRLGIISVLLCVVVGNPGCCEVGADHDPLTAAGRTDTEATLERCRVGERSGYLLHLLPSIQHEVRCETSIAVSLPSAADQGVRNPIQDLHRYPTPHSPFIFTWLIYKVL